MLNRKVHYVLKQLVVGVFGLSLAASLLWLLVRVLEMPSAPAAPPNRILATQRKSVEQRKRAITAYLAARYHQRATKVRSYVDMAWRESARHPDVTPELILAVMQHESSLRPSVSNSYGAQGLMQVVRRWHPEKLRRAESLLDPKVNIRVGAQILQQYIEEQGHERQALAKYSGNATDYPSLVLREKQKLQAI